jgi:hypothetical protein
VERTFCTLQDRLEKRFHYSGIKDIKYANEFLKNEYIPLHNKKFCVKPVAAFGSHKPVGDLNLDSIFSVQYERVVTNDYTFSVNGKKYQIAKENDLRGLTRNKVIIEHRLDGTWHARFRERYLETALLPKKG